MRPDTPLDNLIQQFNHSGLAIIADEEEQVTDILTKIDLLDFLSSQAGYTPNGTDLAMPNQTQKAVFHPFGV